MRNYKSYICYILDIEESTLDNVLAKSKYHIYQIRKRSGGFRKISSPDARLKWVQGKLNHYINKKYEFLSCQHGFVKGKSIVDNAKVHQKSSYILNIDLKNFFPSIHFGRVRGVFMAEPFNLPNPVATILAKIACYHNELPQGSPCSPSISNIVCYSMDKKLLKLGEQYHFRYTRYADDITLSSDKPFPKEIVMRTQDNYVIIGKRLRNIIENQGFTINEKKTNYSWKNERKEVTGLIVNEKVNIKKVYLKQVRALLNRAEKEGLYEAAKYYFNYPKDYNSNHDRNKLVKNIEKVIEGKLNFIAMVRGKDDLVYLKYHSQYLKIQSEYSLGIHHFERKKVEDQKMKEIENEVKELGVYLKINKRYTSLHDYIFCFKIQEKFNKCYYLPSQDWDNLFSLQNAYQERLKNGENPLQKIIYSIQVPISIDYDNYDIELFITNDIGLENAFILYKLAQENDFITKDELLLYKQGLLIGQNFEEGHKILDLAKENNMIDFIYYVSNAYLKRVESDFSDYLVIQWPDQLEDKFESIEITDEFYL